jgi:hypothetical protein
MIEVVSGFKFTDSTDPLDGRNNFPTIADMKACEICDEGHITFCKATGKTYRFVSKNIDGTSKTKDSTYGYWEEFENSKIPLKSNSTYPTSIKAVGKEDSNVVEADETIALGVGVYGDKQRSFGWGFGYQALWLTGSNKQYTVRMDNPSNVTEYKQPLEALATAWIGGYILTSGTTHTRAAKVTAANFSNGVLTITTDTDLGTLNDTKYTYESKTGQQNFCAGTFINSSRQNIAIGTSNFVASNLSTTIGIMNGSTENALQSTTIGGWNNNGGKRGTIVGKDNTLKT